MMMITMMMRMIVDIVSDYDFDEKDGQNDDIWEQEIRK